MRPVKNFERPPKEKSLWKVSQIEPKGFSAALWKKLTDYQPHASN